MPIENPKVIMIAGKIREKREAMNYTQQYVAGKLRITQNAYSKIECGRISLNVQRLFEIAAALETDSAVSCLSLFCSSNLSATEIILPKLS